MEDGKSVYRKGGKYSYRAYGKCPYREGRKSPCHLHDSGSVRETGLPEGLNRLYAMSIRGSRSGCKLPSINWARIRGADQPFLAFSFLLSTEMFLKEKISRRQCFLDYSTFIIPAKISFLFLYRSSAA